MIGPFAISIPLRNRGLGTAAAGKREICRIRERNQNLESKNRKVSLVLFYYVPSSAMRVIVEELQTSPTEVQPPEFECKNHHQMLSLVSSLRRSQSLKVKILIPASSS